jgi:hypothetical protein
MPSTQNSEYYNCLLDGKLVAPGQTTKEYKRIKDGHDPVPLPAPAPDVLIAAVGPAAAHSDSGDDEILGAVIPAGVVDPMVVDSPATPVDESESSDSSSTEPDSEASADSDEVMGGPEELAPPPVMPDFIDGGRLTLEDRSATWGYVRLCLKCASHPKCIKKRAIGAAQRRHFGQHEPLGYLGAWQSMGGEVDRATHKARDFNVPLERQRQWLAENDLL